jgi:hypothetical protein
MSFSRVNENDAEEDEGEEERNLILSLVSQNLD